MGLPKSYSDSVGTRLKNLVDEGLRKRGVSARQASMEVVGHDGLIRDIRAGRIPSVDRVEALFDYLGLEYYFGPPRQSIPAVPTPEEEEELIYIPEYNPRASAGRGATASEEEVIVREIGFRDAFLRDLGVTADQCSLIRASGDSMLPTIPDGSLLLLDHGQINVSREGIFVLNVDGDLFVKRVSRRLDGVIDVISDNAHYPNETIGPDRIHDLRIIGRVVYYCRRP